MWDNLKSHAKNAKFLTKSKYREEIILKKSQIKYLQSISLMYTTQSQIHTHKYTHTAHNRKNIYKIFQFQKYVKIRNWEMLKTV